MAENRPIIRYVYVLIAIVALAASLAAVQRFTRLSEFPPGFTIERLAYPVRVDDQVVGSPAELRFVAQSRLAGSVLVIRSAQGVDRVPLVPQITRLNASLNVLEGLLLFAVSLIVFAPRASGSTARLFFWCTLLYGVAVMIGGMYLPRSASPLEVLSPFVWVACLMALPVLFLRVSLAFPRRSALLDRRPGSLRAVAALAALLFAWQAVSLARYLIQPSPDAWRWLTASRTAAMAFLVVAVALACVLLYLRGRTLELTREREQTKWLLWGFTIGVTPYVFLRTLPKLLGLEPPVPPEVDRVFELAIPMAFTFAVARYRFLDIDIIIRRSLIYGILAGIVAGGYLVAWVFAGQRLIERYPPYAGLIQVVAIAIPVLLFAPTRRWIGDWVDRTFFKLQYNFANALVGLDEALRGASSQEEIAETALVFLEGQLRLRQAAVVVRRREEVLAAGDLGDGVAVEAFHHLEARPSSPRRLVIAPAATSRPDLEASDFSPELSRAGIRIAAPLRSDGASLGALLIGEKGTERRFIEEELKLIESVALQTIAALERIELVQIAAEEAIEREKVQALERMKSDFFARVAHDLRTPITSIGWTVRNLLDGVAGPASPGHVPHLRAMEASTTQLVRLIHNLLDLSRLEQPEPLQGEAPVDLGGVVEEALQLVEPIAAARRIRLDLARANGPLPPVRGDANRIREVVANLVENATRYSPDDSRVEVEIGRCAEGGQRLAVRDHGPGLADEDSVRLFERFQQGRPSPYSRQRGFGLGLFVVRTYVEGMGGSVTAGNHPEGGARFVCTFQEWEGS